MFRLRNLLLLTFFLINVSVASAQLTFYYNERRRVTRAVLETNLLTAVNDGNESSVHQLLQKGADARMTDDCGHSILLYATLTSRPGIMKLLIGAGADVNVVDGSGATAVSRAVNIADPEARYAVVKLLIESGANVNVGHGRTPLMEAVSQEDVGLVELLIAWGVDVNLQDNGSSAYSLAAERGNQKLRGILLAAGADPTVGVAKYRNIYGQHAFFQAAADGRVDVVEAMLANGTATVNMTNGLKVTALMRARDEVMADALLNAAADLNMQDDRGFTALMWAAEIGRVGVVKKLIAAGADVNLRRNDGRALIDLVEDDSEIGAFLKEAGAKRPRSPR